LEDFVLCLTLRVKKVSPKSLYRKHPSHLVLSMSIRVIRGCKTSQTSVTPNTTSTPHRSTILPQNPPAAAQPFQVSVRATLTTNGRPFPAEVCGWFRCKYSDLPMSDIDVVSSGVTQPDPTTNTSPSLSPTVPTDSRIISPQLAAFRHAYRRTIFCCPSTRFRSDKGVDQALAFVPLAGM